MNKSRYEQLKQDAKEGLGKRPFLTAWRLTLVPFILATCLVQAVFLSMMHFSITEGFSMAFDDL